MLAVTNVSSVPLQDTAQAQAAFAADPITKFQTDPAMGRLYEQLFAVCLQNQVTEFTHFYVCGYWGRGGYWGAKQFLTDADGPKGTTLLKWAAANNS